MDQKVTAEELALYRDRTGDRVKDFPDEILKGDFEFQWWLFGHRLGVLIRAMLGERLCARLGLD